MEVKELIREVKEKSVVDYLVNLTPKNDNDPNDLSSLS